MDFRFKRILGYGRGGKALLCNFRGVEVAPKTADLYKTLPKILGEMQNELHIYLTNLKDIPELSCFGYYGGGWCFVMGTRVVVGVPLSDDNKISEREIPLALESLDEIHKCGILHSDIRAENILLDRFTSSTLAWHVPLTGTERRSCFWKKKINLPVC